MSSRRGGGSHAAAGPDHSTIADALVDPSARARTSTSVSPVVSAVGDAHLRAAPTTTVSSFVGTTPSWFAASNTPVGTGAGVHRRRRDPGPPGGGDRADRGRGAVRPAPTRSARQVTAGRRRCSPWSACWPRRARTGFQDANDTAIAPLTAVRQVLTGYGALSSILVEADELGPGRRRRRPRSPRSSTSGRHQRAGDATAPYRITNAAQLLADADRDRRHVHHAARRGRRDQPAGRRHRHHQHHAGHGHRADPRDRHPQGPRRTRGGRSSPSS